MHSFKKLLRPVAIAISILFYASMPARADVTVVANRSHTLPIGDLSGAPIAVVHVGRQTDGNFYEMCGRYATVVQYQADNASQARAVLSEIKSSSRLIIAVNAADRGAVEAFNLLASHPGSIAVFFVPEKDMSAFSGASSAVAVLTVEGDSKPSDAAQVIFGGMAASGRGGIVEKSRLGYASLPDQGLEQKVDSIVAHCIKSRAFPGCQVLVAKGGDVVFSKSYGQQTYDASSPRITDRTLFDIASMSKATATLAGLMAVIDRYPVALTDKLGKYIPELRDTDKGSLTLSDLLYHRSGMPAVLNMYALMADSASYRGRLISYKRRAPYTIAVDKNVYINSDARLRTDIQSPRATAQLDVEAGKNCYVGDTTVRAIMQAIYGQQLKPSNYRYSCLNFALLADVIQRVTDTPLDAWVDLQVFRRIGAWHTGYRPSEWHETNMIAPTEKDNFLRRQLIQGYAHDEMAAFSKGVQGNAGLFSTADDIAKLCATWLAGGSYGGEKIFSPSTVRLFTGEVEPRSGRGLGFDRAARYDSMKKAGIPESVFGHTGFTGTCFWIDPENDLIYVFLSNRVYPSRDNPAFTRLNPRVSILAEVYKYFGL